MTTTRHLILIGYRATGKTTLARILAEKLKMSAVDSDPILEQKVGMNIAEIFKQQGEEYFRDLESEVIAEILQREQPIILATGGGVPIREENRKLLKRSGLVVWLQASAETILARIMIDPTTGARRPQLTDLPPREEILHLLKSRAPFYRETAHFEVDTERLSLDEVAEHVCREFRRSPL